MRPIVLRDLRLRHGRRHYVLTIEAVEWGRIEITTDNNLGHIMSAISVASKEFEARATGQPRQSTDVLTGTIALSKWTIVPLTVWPWCWEMTMESGNYRFTCRLDSAWESVLNGCAAAMRFFGMKYGLVTVWPEVTRNTEQARELGLLTEETTH